VGFFSIGTWVVVVILGLFFISSFAGFLPVIFVFFDVTH
jgi:hypothetical protein